MKAVFLHGFGADCLSWLGNMGALPEVVRISPDLRGHGKSLDALQTGSIEDLAAGVLAEVEDEAPAWLVGHSLGGGVALWLAAHYPERWLGLSLMAPLGLGEDVDLERLENYPEISGEDEMMRFLESLVSDPSIIKREFATYAMSQLEKPNGREALRKILHHIPQAAKEVQTLLPMVAQSGLNVSVFWGREDSVVRPDTGLIEKVGHLRQLDGVGHIVHVEAMKKVNAHLRQTFGLIGGSTPL